MDNTSSKPPDPGSRPRPEEQPPAPSEGSPPRGGSGARDGRGIARLLATVEWLGNLLPHPVTLFALFALGVVVISGICAAAGLSVGDPRPGREDEVFAVRSLLSGEGVRWISQNPRVSRQRRC